MLVNSKLLSENLGYNTYNHIHEYVQVTGTFRLIAGVTVQKANKKQHKKKPFA